MSCEKCRKALDALENRVTSINSVGDEDCLCENHSVSQHSPSHVDDGEHLLLVVRSPDGINENGTLHPVTVEQALRNGLSVQRDCSPDDEVILCVTTLKGMWAIREKSPAGIMRFKASDIRILKDDRRASCVYDTGEDDKPHHAEIMASASKVSEIDNCGTKKEKKLVRERYYKLLIDQIGTEFILVEQFRSGILVDRT